MGWSQKEISEYTQVESNKLDRLYSERNIPINNPESRAEYLAEQVLKLTQIDQEVIIEITRRESKPAALNLLERMFLLGDKTKI